MNKSDIETLALIFAIVTTVFWMTVGWRAMRAHERLAAASEVLARKPGPGTQT